MTRLRFMTAARPQEDKAPSEDDVLRRMLNTPPKQHKPKPEPRPAEKEKRG